MSLYQVSCQIYKHSGIRNWAVFKLSLIQNCFLFSVCLNLTCDWLTQFALTTQPIMRKVKANLDKFDFPLFRWCYLYLLLAIIGSLYCYRDWIRFVVWHQLTLNWKPLSVYWFSCYERSVYFVLTVLLLNVVKQLQTALFDVYFAIVTRTNRGEPKTKLQRWHWTKSF